MHCPTTHKQVSVCCKIMCGALKMHRRLAPKMSPTHAPVSAIVWRWICMACWPRSFGVQLQVPGCRQQFCMGFGVFSWQHMILTWGRTPSSQFTRSITNHHLMRLIWFVVVFWLLDKRHVKLTCDVSAVRYF
jgi:hypothetical protein